MIDKTQEIKEFLNKHFEPGTLEDHTFLKNNQGVLNMIFDVFPDECIDSYELHEILSSLGYEPVKKTTTKKSDTKTKSSVPGFTPPSIEKKEKADIPKTTGIKFYWCLRERIFSNLI